MSFSFTFKFKIIFSDVTENESENICEGQITWKQDRI